MSAIISNASPLIALCSIERLQILKSLWKKIVIPQAVYREVVEKGAGKTGAEVVASACDEWIKVVTVKNLEEVRVLKTVLDEGEAEVIALGQELKAKLLLLDNREPRLFASGVNLNVIGTIGIVKLAWEKDLIDDPIIELQKLRFNGFWISDSLMAKIKNDIEKKDFS
jgi:predicted nucleic acid-binding protein